MSADVTQRVSAEGADPLALAGVNDGNLVELARRLGVRVSLRGDTLALTGPEEAVGQAVPIARALIELARVGDPLDVHDVERLVAAAAQGTLAHPVEGEPRIILPGLRRVIQAKTAGQREYLDNIQQHEIVVGIGPAGTGKTYLAVAAAVEALGNETVRRLVLVRPAVEAGERLGFLPGDMSQKIDPYLRPIYDALYEMLGFERVGKLIDRHIIEVAPLAFMRGRTLNESFVILDEAQNTTPEQMKMFLTRIGFGSRAVVTGDITQTDLPPGKESGLKQVQRILKGVTGIEFVYFGSRDVVRHPLVQKIVAAYDRDNVRDDAESDR